MAALMLRHTRPDVAPGVCYGQTDLELADSFEQEAAAVLDALPAFSEIVSSPLIRCRKLAAFIAARHARTVRVDARVSEMNFGRWEGRLWDEIPRDELDLWAADFMHARPHGGESVSDLKARVDSALAEFRSGATPPLIVTHAGVIRSALARGTEARHFQTQVDFGQIIRLAYTEEETT